MFVERLSIWVVAFSFLLYCSMSFSLLFNIIGSSPAWFALKKKWQIQVHYVKVCGTEDGDQRGGEWEPIKISSEIQTVGLYPKTTANPRT